MRTRCNTGHNILMLMVFVGLVSASCTSDSNGSDEPATGSSRPAGSMVFSSCEALRGGFECATVDVPRDHSDPDGPTVPIAVARLASTDAGARIGTLVLNPGGPLPVLSSAGAVAGLLSEDLRRSFDLIVFDPRGLGESAGVDCNFDVDDLFRGLDYTPDDDAELVELAEANARIAQACAQSPSSDLLPHLGIGSIARDMDTIRAAIGEDQLNYLGLSWGTYLGAWYAELFPDRVRAMVLDGAVDPAASPEAALLAQANGFENSLDAFLAWCDGSPSCGFRRSDSARVAWDALVAEVDASPIPAGDAAVGPAEFDLGVAALLYGGDESYEALDAALDEARAGEASTIWGLYADYAGIVGDGDDGGYEGFLALSCIETPFRSDDGAEALDALATEAAGSAPNFGPSTVYLSLPCVEWPTPDGVVGGSVSAPGAPPILVVGTTGDPATPYEQAVALADALVSGVLVTQEGSQHTAYGRSACVTDLVDRYFVALDVPSPETRCT